MTMSENIQEARTGLLEFVKAMAPVLIVGVVGIALLPSGGNPSFFELAWYQQIVSASFLPAMLWSCYRVWNRSPGPTFEEWVGIDSEDSERA